MNFGGSVLQQFGGIVAFQVHPIHQHARTHIHTHFHITTTITTITICSANTVAACLYVVEGQTRV